MLQLYPKEQLQSFSKIFPFKILHLEKITLNLQNAKNTAHENLEKDFWFPQVTAVHY